MDGNIEIDEDVFTQVSSLADNQISNSQLSECYEKEELSKQDIESSGKEVNPIEDLTLSSIQIEKLSSCENDSNVFNDNNDGLAFQKNQTDSNLKNVDDIITDVGMSTKSVTTPSLVFDQIKMITGSWNEFRSKDRYREIFLKGCKWSPDGTCLLTNSNDATMRLFDLPFQLYNCSHLPNVDYPELQPSVKTKIGGLVYDYEWYPLMTSTKPETCCFVTTSSFAPVQLWDAYTGELRCSYRGYNAQDELHAALSVVFHPSGEMLLSGYKDSVNIFHTGHPGRDYTTISTKELCEQKGIVSCIAVNPMMPNIFAAGTYSKTVGLYSVDGHAMCLMVGQGGGLTQVIFSHDGSRLFTAGRKDSEILCWDLRSLGDILYIMKRPHFTNQRIYMDLTSDDHYLLSGSANGSVYVWDLQAAPTISANSHTTVIEHVAKWHAHNDCVNGLSVHRHIPLVATASGQRYIPEIIEDSENDDVAFATERPEGKFEDSVKLWWANKIDEQKTCGQQLNPVGN